jgi:hypothetical protein
MKNHSVRSKCYKKQLEDPRAHVDWPIIRDRNNRQICIHRVYNWDKVKDYFK